MPAKSLKSIKPKAPPVTKKELLNRKLSPESRQMALNTMQNFINRSLQTMSSIQKTNSKVLNDDKIPLTAGRYRSFGGFNPDPVLSRYGSDTYSKMAADDSIDLIQRLKIEVAFSEPWYIKPATNDPIDIRLADWMEDQLRNLRLPVEDPFDDSDLMIDLIELSKPMWLDKMNNGFKISWLLKAPRDGQIVLKSIIPKDIDMIRFEQNDYGALKYIDIGYGGQKIYPKDFKNILFQIHRMRNTNFHGQSDLKNLYREWHSKDVITNFLDIFTEFRSMGYWFGYFDRSELKNNLSDYQAFEDGMQNLKQQAGMLIPFEHINNQRVNKYEMEFKEMSGTGATVFQQAIEMYDTRIKRHLMAPDKLGYTNSEGGAYNLGVKQIDLFGLISGNISSDFKSTFNNYVIKRIFRLNYGDAVTPSTMEFKKTKTLNAAIAQAVVLLKQNGFVKPGHEKFIEEELGLPVADEGIITEIVDAPDAGVEAPQPTTFAVNVIPDDRVDLQKWKKDLTSIEEDGTKVIVDEMDVVEAEFVKQINKKGLLESKDKALIDEIVFPSSSMSVIKKQLNQTMLRGHFTGKDTFFKESKKAGFDLTEMTLRSFHTKNFQTFAVTNDGFELTKKWINDWIKQYGINLNSGDSKAISDISDRAFYLTRNLRDEVLKKVKDTLYDGISRDQTTSEILGRITNDFNAYQDTGSINGSVPEPYRIDNLIRTETTRSFNSGRLTSALDPELGGIVKAAKYVATLDERTTEFCEKHNDQVILVTNPMFTQIIPPVEYGCRSVVVFLYEGEDIKETWTATPKRPVFP